MPLDAAAVVELIDRHAAALRALAAQWSDTPEDLVQEAFCRLLTRRKPPDYPGAWLFKVVRNLARTQYQVRRRREAREQRVAVSEEHDNDPGSVVETKEIAAMLQLLEPELRDIVIMRLWGGLTLEEIAVAYGTSVATAHRRYREALEKLRREMGIPCPNQMETNKQAGK